MVPLAAEPILGLTACQDLGLVRCLCSTDASSSADQHDPMSGIHNDPVARTYSDLFQGLGHIQKYPYTIRVRSDATPFAVAVPRRVPCPLLDKVKAELQRMMESDVIKEVTEPTAWVSPMVPVPKKDGSVRICVDLTKLNRSVQREQFQLPTSEQVFAQLQGAKYFSTLDASSGFWQIPLSEDCSSLTTFITPFGCYRFTRLPFGITSGPEVFHRTMQHMLAGQPGMACYMDDILVWGSTAEEHDVRLREVLERCRSHGVKLNPSKCVLRKTQVKFFGHVLTSDGVKADDDKLRAIREMTSPQNKDDLRRYLGMVDYLTKFLPGYSQVAAPLRELLKEDVTWYRSPEQETSFQRLREMVITTPVLAFYSPTATTTVSADASSHGLGGVLLQVQEDGRRAPVSYVSRALTAAERRYSQIEKEALAMVWSCEKFHCHLFGRDIPFQIETDHKPLLSIMNIQNLDQCPPRLQRLRLRMMKLV